VDLVLATGLSLLLHLGLVLPLGKWLPPGARDALAVALRRERDRAEEEARKRPPLHHVLVDTRRPEEAPDPAEAEAVGSLARVARERAPAPELPKGPARTEGPSRFAAQLAGSRAARTVSPGTPAPPPRPAERPRTEPTVEETRKQPLPRRPHGELPAPPDPREEREAARPEPVVRRIGEAARPEGQVRRTQSATSARLVGSPSLAVLRSRWGEYMDVVARRLQQSLDRQAALHPRSYRHGVVQVGFGIAPDGSVTDVRLLSAESGMVTEQAISVRTVETAGPFPPLTPEMRTDEHFRAIVLNVEFH
jgi:hypothetical protein